jgi:hypothetical protein
MGYSIYIIIIIINFARLMFVDYNDAGMCNLYLLLMFGYWIYIALEVF